MRMNEDLKGSAMPHYSAGTWGTIGFEVDIYFSAGLFILSFLDNLHSSFSL